jgi:hypothetical protein
MPTFSQLETSQVVRTLATGSTSQLFRLASFVRSGTTDVGGVPLKSAFEKGEQTRIKRIKDFGAAQDYDPRSGVDAQSQDAEYTFTPLTLDKLFVKGHPVYSQDAQAKTYCEDFFQTIGGALRLSFDDYLYERGFTDWTALPTVGTVQMASNPTIQIVYEEDATGQLVSFGDNVLTAAGTTLDRNEVPSDGKRYGRISPDAGLGIDRSTTLVTGFAAASASSQPGNTIISDGIPMDMDFQRRGFNIAKTVAVKGRNASTNIGDGTATSTVTAAVTDTTVFFNGDKSVGGVNVPLGAVRLTIGVAAPSLNASVAVGQICRLGAVNAPALAYGVILRVDLLGKFVWVVPYSANGIPLVAAQIPGATVFSIPRIGSVNPFYHAEHLVYATRLLSSPSEGSGAYSAAGVDPTGKIVSQVFKGGYQVNRLRESMLGTLLCGAAPSDHRKSVLALAQ